MTQVEYLGNTELLNNRKTAFLCSRSVGGGAVLRCYDWATQMIEEHVTVISGFQSTIEQGVLEFLIKGNQPIIIVLARKMYKEIPQILRKPLEDGRLLIISTSPKSSRISRDTARIRNHFIADKADDIVFGYISTGSSLTDLYSIYKHKSKVLFSGY